MKTEKPDRVINSRFISICLLLWVCQYPLLAFENAENKLLAKLSHSKPAEKVAILTELGQYHSDFNYPKALTFTDQAIKLAIAVGDSAGLAKALYTDGIIHQLQGENNEAHRSLKQAYSLYTQSNDSLGIARTSDCLGSLFRYYGAYEKSLEYHLWALAVFEKRNDTTGKISAMNNIGIVYRSLDNYTKSISYYQKALGLAKESNSSLLSTVYNSIGSYYYYLKEYKSANYYYRRALDIVPTTLALKERHCAALNNIGNVYRSKEQLDSALFYYSLSLKESKILGLINLSAITLKNIGTIYARKGEVQKAEEFLLKSIHLSKKSNIKQVVRDDYLILSNLYGKNGDYKKALKYHKQYSEIQDSIHREEQSSKVELLEVDYLFQQKEKDLAILMKNNAEKNLEIQTSRNLLLISILIIFILITLTIGIYRLLHINRNAKQNLLQMNEKLEERVMSRTVKLELEIANHRNTAVELLKAKEKAEESDRLKSTFLSNISHEIRTPMNAIVGFTGLLSSPDLQIAERDQYIEVINKSGNYLLSIIDDIIEISKIEAGQITLHYSQVSVNSLLDQLYDTFKAEIPEEKDISLNVTIPKETLTISTDPVKLRQVLSSLLSNAIKFTEKGSITLGYQKANSTELTFFVSDTGIGIDEKHRQIIFDRFRQVENKNETKKGGSGLGLAISKAYIDKLGGTITLESEIGKGSTFTFTLPI